MKVSIKITGMDKLTTRTRVVEEKEDGEVVDQHIVTSLTFEGYVPPVVMARILNLQKQKAPMYLEVGSDQAVMDLHFTREDAENFERANKAEIEADHRQTERDIQAEVDAVNQSVEWQERQDQFDSPEMPEPEGELVTQG